MQADVAIIGGGIAGVSLAARLAPHASVILLEAEASLAHHASSRSAALFEPRYGSPAVVELSLASETFFQTTPGILSPRGLMMVGGAGDEAAFASESAPMALDPISLAEAQAMVPILNLDRITQAAWSSQAWDIDTDLLLQGFAREARAAGATVLTRAAVSAIRRDGAIWHLNTAQGPVSAGIIVNAAGAWVDQIAALAGVVPLGFTPYRRSMARIPAPAGHDTSRWPMIFGAGEAWYAKPDAGALIVSPAEEDAAEPHDAWADDMVLAEGLARYESMVTEPVTRLLSSWAGLRTFAPDRSLVIGADKREPTFFWLAGQGGQGFQSCPAASTLAADLILGRRPDLPPALVQALSPARLE
ncbi:NAD(P)/FAD-dependent oxidoreductase [Pseudotabrizicola algicola]|uniref:FAD-binding oxidoreductase n=1 Tax=Pseudotabrizicola algicola TaxID=2709381 RepID=A0A6B3RM18_9RHOB|nr:FAD-binding oxidoreductase [Pseudotabrizicola algicola]NEX45878.1 FAD-binding oxidoreductase [Pseudotabrizicola algicola]